MPETEREVVQSNVTESPEGQGTSSNARAQLIAAISIILLLAAVAGGFGWYEWKQHRRPDEQLVDLTSPRMFNFGGGPRGATFGSRPPPPPLDPNALQDTFHVGNARLRVVRLNAPTSAPANAAANEYRFAFAFVPSLMTSEQALYVTARMNSLLLQLTSEQVKSLAAIKQNPDNMLVSGDDREKMRLLWKAYVAAPPSDRASKANDITTALAEIAKRSEAATRLDIADRVAKVKAILTADQIAKLANK